MFDLSGILSSIPVSLLQVFLVVVNGVAFIVFGIDKFRSKKKGWRISESNLLFSAFLGPFGACAGMLLFRHKTRKIRFLLVPFFLLVQVILMIYLYFKR